MSMRNLAIKHYLNSQGRWSPYKSEERRKFLKEERERSLKKNMDKNKQELPYNVLFGHAVNFLYKEVAHDELLTKNTP